MSRKIKKGPEIDLKVAEAVQDDVDKGVVRIDSAFMREIGIREGDIVEIEGKRKTVVIAARGYPGDIGLNIIRMDGLTRRNARTSIGEYVKVRKVSEIKEARKVVIAPAQKGIMIRASPYIFKKGLLGRAVIRGDLLSLGGTRTRRRTLMDSPFEDIFDMIKDESLFTFGLRSLRFIVADTNPKGPVIITDSTDVIFNPQAVEVTEETQAPAITYEDIGGLDEEIRKIREMVELPLKHPELFERLGIEPPKGVLLYGPPGTGKTLLAKAVANESEAKFFVINGPELMSKYYGQTEANLRKIFQEAEKNAPSIIFIDEIDAIAPRRDEVVGEVERRLVAQLLAIMDGLKSRGKVIVIAATNMPNVLDPALRRPGRFDREIEISVPNKKARLEILKIHTRNMPLAKNVKLGEIADITHGFVGADLSNLAKEAAMIVLRRILPKIKWEEEQQIPQELLDKLLITQNDFKEALRVVRPSALREFYIEKPNVKWKDIGGLEEIKQELKEAVEWPLKYAKEFEHLGINPPKGILLYGPPGTGKTLLAKAVANESQSNFLLIKGPEVLSMWVGESERAIRKIFEKARQTSPTILFFDEIDAIAPRRAATADSKVTERIVNQLLTEMDGLEELEDVVIIAATNRPDIIDPALLRPGRFDRLLLVNAPSEKARQEIFKVHTKEMPLAKDIKLDELAKQTEGYVGADIEAVCREAGLMAMREDIKAKEIKKKHFDQALKKIGPSVTKEIMKTYKEIGNILRRAKSEEVRKEKPKYFG